MIDRFSLRGLHIPDLGTGSKSNSHSQSSILIRRAAVEFLFQRTEFAMRPDDIRIRERKLIDNDMSVEASRKIMTETAEIDWRLTVVAPTTPRLVYRYRQEKQIIIKDRGNENNRAKLCADSRFWDCGNLIPFELVFTTARDDDTPIRATYCPYRGWSYDHHSYDPLKPKPTQDDIKRLKKVGQFFFDTINEIAEL